MTHSLASNMTERFDTERFDTEGSIDDLGSEARAEFDRLQAFLDLVEAPVPTEVGRYRIERVIGRGGMGVVHLAVDPELGRSVALKLVHAGPFVNRERLHARLQREARVLAQLSHPNVVAVHDVGTHEGELFVAMQYVPGSNLRVWQEAEPRTPEQVLAAYLQAARGLAAVHRAGIVHRDFKPDNVLIDDEGQVRVGDFGLADDRDLELAPGSDRDHDRDHDDIRTHSGALMGTLRYMAPERLCGEPASKASDQFEFCVSLWEALTGARPFIGEQRDVLVASMTCPPHARAKLDRRVRRVLERGLAREPGQRFASVDALIEALEHERHPGRWLAGVALASIAGLALARALLDPDTCEIADRVDLLGDHELVLPEASTEAATEIVQARFDRMIVALRVEASGVCRLDQPGPKARLGRWVDVLALVVEHSPELAPERTLATLAELEFERDRDPPELTNREVARLIDEARAHLALGQMDEAERATERAAELAEQHSDRAEVALRLGQLANWRGRPHAALAHYQEAIDQAEMAKLDRSRLAAHLLAAPIALTGAHDRDAADHHHRQAGLLLERLGLGPNDPARIEHDQNEALIASEDQRFDVALAIQQRVLARWLAEGDPLKIAEARKQLALLHQGRADAVKEPRLDREAAEAAYRQVIVELDALGVAPSQSTRLAALHNLGLLLYTPDASPAQRDEVEALMNVVFEVGPSKFYISAVQVLVGLLVGFDEPSPTALAEAKKLIAKLSLELQEPDLAPRDRLDAWTIVASLATFEADLVEFEFADAKVHALAQAAVDEGWLTPVERDIQLAMHSMQVAALFERSSPDRTPRLRMRASDLLAALPAEAREKPEVADMIAIIAAAADARDEASPR